jgi:hypothetical protein
LSILAARQGVVPVVGVDVNPLLALLLYDTCRVPPISVYVAIGCSLRPLVEPNRGVHLTQHRLPSERFAFCRDEPADWIVKRFDVEAVCVGKASIVGQKRRIERFTKLDYAAHLVRVGATRPIVIDEEILLQFRS